MGGQVVDTKGNGISNVKILLDGEEKAVSDEKGFYKLQKVFLVKLYIYLKLDNSWCLHFRWNA